MKPSSTIQTAIPAAPSIVPTRPRPGLGKHLYELYRHRELLWMWTLREIKIRYKQTVLGGAWAILQPVVLMVAFTVMFSYLTRIPSDGIPYPVFSYVALVPWMLLAVSITFAVPSLINNLNLVTKIYFPREILPIATLIVAFHDFLIASAVLGALLVYYEIPLMASALWVPVLLAIQIALTLGISLLLSTLSVWYRDIRFVVPLGIQLWMYGSPVIYPVSLVPEKFRSLYMLNPMSFLIDSYRKVILHGQNPDFQPMILAAVVAVTTLVAGYYYFKRAEAQFADVI